MPSKQPTVARPYVDRHWLTVTTAVKFYDGHGELNLIDPNTGVVVYTTPTEGDFDYRALDAAPGDRARDAAVRGAPIACVALTW